METLKKRLQSRTRRVYEAQRRAAVLVPVVVTNNGYDLILTRRTEHLSTHRGQVAFPGGGHDLSDETLVATALREAEEEIGLAPHLVRIVGLLDDIPTVTEETIVTPVVGRLDAMPTLIANPAEVARIFSVPFSVLSRAENWRTETTTHKGRRYPIYFLDYGGETLWGLSAYVTRQLLKYMNLLDN